MSQTQTETKPPADAPAVFVRMPTITDTGADGTISVAGLSTLDGAGAFKTSATTWQSHAGQVVYALADSGTGKIDLVIAVASAGATGRIFVRDWAEGRLGISLGTTPIPQIVERNYTGDYLKSESNGHFAFDPLTLNVASAGAQANAPDWLVGSFADDQIQGLGGNELVQGGDETDAVPRRWATSGRHVARMNWLTVRRDCSGFGLGAGS